MDLAKVDKLLQLALAAASHNDFGAKKLGPIHLIKYVYLADLEYAKDHDGRTYTGIKWQFYHYGPWSLEVFHRIEPALEAIGAYKEVIQSAKYEDDFVRWSCSEVELYDRLLSEMDFVAALPVKGFVQKYGSDTHLLLHDVYKTDPMLNAAPGELLDFSFAKREPKALKRKEKRELSTGQLKRINKRREGVKKVLQERLAKRLEAKKGRKRQPEPEYDELYFEGLKALDALAGENCTEGRIVCSLSDEIWKSKARHDPELS